jgi:2-keto-4-pentenoate hydratase/2-oxohepta-3-ene-1,7-dioic acid hydratase in catechol pathway
MKIICIGKNFREHAKELNSEVPKEPLFFMKPDSALLLGNKPFYLPDFSNEIHHEVEIVVKINRLGKHIEKQFAHRYYNDITVGVDFTARDLQRTCIKEGKPWEIAKAFDGSAVLGTFISLLKVKDRTAIPFHLDVDGITLQKGNSNNMVFSIDELITYVSKFLTLKIGDLIFTGTPVGVGPVKINQRLEGFIEDMKLFDFLIK